MINQICKLQKVLVREMYKLITEQAERVFENENLQNPL